MKTGKPRAHLLTVLTAITSLIVFGGASASEQVAEAAAGRGGCPAGMAKVGATCMDRYEAPNQRGVKPLVMQNAHDAETWCAKKGKRLCTEDEWVAACEGSQKRTYPYGTTHEEGRCNDEKLWRQVDEAILASWPSAEAKKHTQDLNQSVPSGSQPGCVSEAHIYDLTGNVEEWVKRTRPHNNNYENIMVGCYWAGCYGGNKPTCHSANSAHEANFRFYETGFRCCKDAR